MQRILGGVGAGNSILDHNAANCKRTGSLSPDILQLNKECEPSSDSFTGFDSDIDNAQRNAVGSRAKQAVHFPKILLVAGSNASFTTKDHSAAQNSKENFIDILPSVLRDQPAKAHHDDSLQRQPDVEDKQAEAFQVSTDPPYPCCRLRRTRLRPRGAAAAESGSQGTASAANASVEITPSDTAESLESDPGLSLLCSQPMSEPFEARGVLIEPAESQCTVQVARNGHSATPNYLVDPHSLAEAEHISGDLIVGKSDSGPKKKHGHPCPPLSRNPADIRIRHSASMALEVVLHSMLELEARESWRGEGQCSRAPGSECSWTEAGHG